MFFKEEFYDKWLQEKTDQGLCLVTPLGVVLNVPPGHPPWRGDISIYDDHCVETVVFEKIAEEFGFRDPMLEESWMATLAGHEEGRLGLLLWIFCYQRLVEEGLIEKDGSSSKDNTPYNAVLSFIGEPGDKVRGPTKTEACVVTYLQPFAHIMNGLLGTDPTLKAGLTAGHMVYEFSKRFKHVKKNPFKTDPASRVVEKPPLPENRIFESMQSRVFNPSIDEKSLSDEVLPKDDIYYAMLGDYTAATNWIEFEPARLHMQSMLSEMSIGKNDYMRTAHELILRPCILTADGTKYRTCRGALMGLPGTKIILHTMGKAIEMASRDLRSPKSPRELKEYPLAIAGDDTMKISKSLSELKKFIPKTEMYSLVPSTDKWRYYKRGGIFCQEVFSLENDTIFVDHVPARALSKETKAKSDEDKNPIFGKAHYLSKRIEWMPRFQTEGSHDQIWFVFQRNHRMYGDYSRIANLPRHLGGLGFTKLTQDETPDEVRKVAYAAWSKRGERDNLALRALRNLSSTLLYDRGDPISSAQHVPGSAMLTKYDHDELVERYGIAKELGITRYWRQKKKIEEIGFLPLDALKSGLKPFWERKKPEKGWNTAPLNLRIRRMADQASELELELPTDEQWSQVKSTDPREYIPRGIYFDPSERFHGIAVNPMQKSRGLSLAWRIPNSAWNRRNCTAEQISALLAKENNFATK